MNSDMCQPGGQDDKKLQFGKNRSMKSGAEDKKDDTRFIRTVGPCVDRDEENCRKKGPERFFTPASSDIIAWMLQNHWMDAPKSLDGCSEITAWMFQNHCMDAHNY